MDLGLNGLRVLVTAGASGIGLHTARAFAREGARVHVCDIDGHALEALRASDPAISTSVCDVSDRGQVDALFADALSALGGLDCLVNNAGIAGPTGAVQDIAPEDWDRCISVTLTGQYNCTRLAVDHLKASSNPSIVNLSSAAGKQGFPLRSPYSAAKWGIIGFTKTLARELGPFGIRCNAILPGVVDGERMRQVISAKAGAAGKTFEQVEGEFLAAASIKEMIDPDQLADMIVFLASNRSRTTSGQAISIDADLQMLA
ncbi:SDR family oxidoreductase [Roseibium sp.]|uniref:SDR family oxidoreductase n=1 Tax=Roseibium sp. TaxID=1936156 RepID=UPI003A971AFF